MLLTNRSPVHSLTLIAMIVHGICSLCLVTVVWSSSPFWFAPSIFAVSAGMLLVALIGYNYLGISLILGAGVILSEEILWAIGNQRPCSWWFLILILPSTSESNYRMKVLQCCALFILAVGTMISQAILGTHLRISSTSFAWARSIIDVVLPIILLNLQGIFAFRDLPRCSTSALGMTNIASSKSSGSSRIHPVGIRNSMSDMAIQVDIDTRVQQHIRRRRTHSIVTARNRRYSKARLIGRGGYSAVYMGIDLDSGELLAVKSITEYTSEQQNALEREIELLTKLQHPRIVRYLGTDRQDGEFCILLEYVPGGTITTLLQQFGAFTESMMQIYVNQILEGLAYLHSNGVVHGDIKGDNILIAVNGDIKLCDFGCCVWEQKPPNTTAPIPQGTILFMAPEICGSSSSYPTPKADVWSLGCVCVQMCTASLPWSEMHLEDSVSAFWHISSSQRSPQFPEESLSPSGRDFLNQCLQIQLEDRPTSETLLNHKWLLFFSSSSGSGGDDATLTTLQVGRKNKDFQNSSVWSHYLSSSVPSVKCSPNDIVQLDQHLSFLHSRCSADIMAMGLPQAPRYTASVSSKLSHSHSNNETISPTVSSPSELHNVLAQLAPLGAFHITGLPQPS